MPEPSTITSPTYLSNHELNKNNNKNAKMDGEKTIRPQPSIKNYMPQRSAQSRRNILPQRRVQQLIIQYQMASHEIGIKVTLYGLSQLYLYLVIYLNIYLLYIIHL